MIHSGSIKVSNLGLTILVGVVMGLSSSVPLIWLSWKIPQHLFAKEEVCAACAWSDPAICAFSWQDAVLVVLLCASAMGALAYKGADLNGLVCFCYCAVLLLLARIDLRTHLLPDLLTLSLLWAGLLWHAADLGDLSLAQSVWGAVTGYIVLWLPCVCLSRWCGKEVMGHGDFKLSAAIGAWLGCLALPFVWLIASSSSVLIALLASILVGRRLRESMPFGPGLALGGILMLFVDG
jgi:leader peptidase (prepilin peptidase)/N-methyltransferase